MTPASDAPSATACVASASMVVVIDRHNPLSTNPIEAPRNDWTPAARGRSGGASASTGNRVVIFSTTDIRVACTGGHARRTNGSRDNPTIAAHERRGCGCCDPVVLRCCLLVGFDVGRAADRGRAGRGPDDLRDVLDRTDHHAPTDHNP